MHSSQGKTKTPQLGVCALPKLKDEPHRFRYRRLRSDAGIYAQLMRRKCDVLFCVQLFVNWKTVKQQLNWTICAACVCIVNSTGEAVLDDRRCISKRARKLYDRTVHLFKDWTIRLNFLAAILCRKCFQRNPYPRGILKPKIRNRSF